MPISRRVARWNRAGLNRVTRHIAPWLPGFAVVVHRGRKSGRTYRTPVNVFRSGSGYTIALTYGTEGDWLQNVLAAGEAELLTRGRHVRVVSPRIVHDPGLRRAAVGARPVLRMLGVADFLDLDTALIGPSFS